MTLGREFCHKNKMQDFKPCMPKNNKGKKEIFKSLNEANLNYE